MGSCDVVTTNGDFIPYNGLNIIRPSSSYNKLLSSPAPPSQSPSPWFDLRVFYVRITNLTVTDSTPQSLTINHIPLDSETFIELNGRRCRSGAIQSILRRDRVDKKSEEVTFVSTDSVRFTSGSIRFEVCDGEDELILTGALENMSSEEGVDQTVKWNLKCECSLHAGSTTGLMKGGRAPTLEVYVAGCFCAQPIILCRTVKVGGGGGNKKKKQSNVKLDPIPEYGEEEAAGDGDAQEQSHLNFLSSLDSEQLPSEYRRNYYKMEEVNNEELEQLYWGRTYSREKGYLDLENEDGDEELSLFNAGIRVGVGISLGICIGVGVGVGLLARTYQKTTRNFRKRLLF